MGARDAVQDRRPVAATRRAQDGEEAAKPTETRGGRKVISRLVPVIVTYRPIQEGVECLGVLIEIHRAEQDAQDDDDVAHVADDAPCVVPALLALRRPR